MPREPMTQLAPVEPDPPPARELTPDGEKPMRATKQQEGVVLDPLARELYERMYGGRTKR